MKRYIKFLIVVLCIFQLVGCANKNGENASSIKAPENNSLTIRGIWSIDDYKILDSEENLNTIKENSIVIKKSEVEIGGKTFSDVRYKLKVVDKSYNISYQANYTIDDLNLGSEKVEVISIIYQNNILGEFIVVDKERCYLYYQGILLSLVWNGEVVEDDSSKKDDSYEHSSYEGNNIGNSSEGLYLGIKTTKSQNNDEKYAGEEYRTLWISTKDNELQEVREKDNIIFPRLSGIWTLEEHNINNASENIYYEYFTATPIDSKIEAKEETTTKLIFTSQGEELHRSINFIGNDYVATEVSRKENGIYTDTYQVLPVDNLFVNNGLLISDLYTKEINKTYESIYEQVYKSLSEDEKSKLSKYISYSNFSVVRNNGKWILKGRISPIGDAEPYDFNTGIKPNKNLMNYDTLRIPWKTLKRDIPLIVDAFTSPDGRLAIIVMENELLIYSINDGVLAASPMKRIPLKEGDKIIMAEWCSADYIDKWGAVFKDNSRIIE